MCFFFLAADLELEDDGRLDDVRFVYWLTETKVLLKHMTSCLTSPVHV